MRADGHRQLGSIAWCGKGCDVPFGIPVQDLHGVEFGTVTRQEVLGDAVGVLGQPGFDRLGLVGGVPVDDQVDVLAVVTNYEVVRD
jgi:hypothetical protein